MLDRISTDIENEAKKQHGFVVLSFLVNTKNCCNYIHTQQNASEYKAAFTKYVKMRKLITSMKRQGWYHSEDDYDVVLTRERLFAWYDAKQYIQWFRKNRPCKKCRKMFGLQPYEIGLIPNVNELFERI